MFISALMVKLFVRRRTLLPSHWIHVWVYVRVAGAKT